MNDPFAYTADADDTIRRPLGKGGRPATRHDAFAPLGREGSDFFAPRAQVGLPVRAGGDDFGLAAPQRMRGFSDDLGMREERPEVGPLSSRDTAIDKAFDLAALNPLVGAASPLLWLAGRLNESAAPDDLLEFRNRLLEEIKRFETSAMARDLPPRAVRVSRYALCATIDDIILNTSWGGQSGWASQSLVGMLYNETWGGERFYDLLSQMAASPEDNVDVLELMAICLSVGFAGKYRVMEGGPSQLTRLRHDLYRTIRRVRGPYDRDLAPPWQSISAPHRAPRSARAAWLIAALVLLLLAALWILASLDLRGRVETAAEAIRNLVPAVPLLVETPPAPAVPDPVVQAAQTQIERISGFLADDIAGGRVEVVAVEPARVAVRLLRAPFPSGGVTIAVSEDPLILRIGRALDGERGPIVVVGHTDNVPVGPGSPLGDNMAVSLARAQSAAEMLKRHISDPSRVSAVGQGENDPIADNATAEGRARNRRVEFQIPAEAAR